MEWLDAKVELPNEGEHVLVLYEGQYAIGWRKGSISSSSGSWLLHVGGKTIAPYPSNKPRWWALLPAAPEGELRVSSDARGDRVVFWRKSVSDLLTDVRDAIDSPKLWDDFVALVERARPAVQSDVVKLVQGRHSVTELVDDLKRLLGGGDVWNAFQHEMSRQQPPVISMLLWCPECNERHVDEGQWTVNRHHTHACQFCGHVWRPAVECTRGVRFLPGFRNAGTPPPAGRDPAHG